MNPLDLLKLICILHYTVSTGEASTAIVDDRRRNLIQTRPSMIGDRCGMFFGECVEGTTCIKAVVGGGRCMPIECITDAIRRYNTNSNIDNTNNGLQTSFTTGSIQSVIDQIFEKAGVTPKQLATSRANEVRSDQTFGEDSDALKAIIEVMKNMDNPFPGLQEALEACSNDIINGDGYENHNNNNDGRNNKTNNNNDEVATPGQTMYYGFHIEGGPVYDGEFSILVAFRGGQPNLTFLRGCFGAGGVGIDVSAVIGIGFTGDPTELLGCSALLTDFEAGAAFAFGIDVGVTFPGVVYLDITLGLGVTAEGFGIGLCGNWQQT